MLILASPARAELIRQKSRFLGLLEIVTDTEDARSKIKQVKAFYTDATHVVHAFRVGPDGSETKGCGDDGEPSGTAGRPVLDVLSGQGGGNALLLVARWFGGTKLGTGGLVQAYGDCAKAVIAAASWEERREWVETSVTVGFAEHRALKILLDEAGARVETEEFGAEVALTAKIPREAFDAVQRRVADLTRGRASFTVRIP